jgi:hypothetical protein
MVAVKNNFLFNHMSCALPVMSGLNLKWSDVTQSCIDHLLGSALCELLITIETKS